jgi:pSer/pThr/pTyr-binding forkhead associated (FHA) protein
MPRVIITVPGKSPQPYRFQLDNRLVTMGRGSNSDIVIDSESVSVMHAQMCRVEGGYELRDCDSTNGIKLDGERIPVVPLYSGTVVYLGDVAFDFQLGDEELQILSSEAPMDESPITMENVIESDSPNLKPVQPQAVRKDVYKSQAAGNRPGCGTFVWLLILVFVAFFVGMAIRHQRETGQSWLPAVFEKIRITKEGGTPEPAKKSVQPSADGAPVAP